MLTRYSMFMRLFSLLNSRSRTSTCSSSRMANFKTETFECVCRSRSGRRGEVMENK